MHTGLPSVRGHSANCNSRRVLGAVSRGYRLVTNAKTLDQAQECCRTVFPKTEPGE